MAVRKLLKSISPGMVRFRDDWPEERLDLPPEDKGGYYPGAPGMSLSTRYSIFRKLGWGQHSNVWLANDNSNQQYVAVKVLSAYATNVQTRFSNELEIMQRVRNIASASAHPGAGHVAMLLDNFKITSKHGDHVCLVTEALGSNLKTIQKAFQRRQMPLELVKNVTRQLLLALDFLHSECQIIHTDIKQDNIQFTIDHARLLEQVKDTTPDPRSQEDLANFPVYPALSCPLHSFSPSELGNPAALSSFTVKLTDFGVATSFDGYHAKSVQPYALRAPEVILGCEWGPKIDIWNLGCLVFEFLTGAWLFQPTAVEGLTVEEYHLAHMEPITGDSFDAALVNSGANSAKYFNEKGNLCVIAESVSLEQALRNYEVLSERDLRTTLSFLQQMLRLNPENRASARELLQHPWLHD